MSGTRIPVAMICLSFAFACAGPPGKDASDAGTPAGVVDYGVMTPSELQDAKMSAVLTGVTIPADGRPVVTLKVTERHGSGVRGLSATAVSWRFALIKLAQGVNGSANDTWVSYMAANDDVRPSRGQPAIRHLDLDRHAFLGTHSALCLPDALKGVR